MHIVDTEERHWIMSRMEAVRSAGVCHPAATEYSPPVERCGGLERPGSKYPGTKRFGLEGGESLVPMMAEAIQRIGGYGAKEICIGIAHRGRLNMLVNILGKNPSIFSMSSRAKQLTRAPETSNTIGVLVKYDDAGGEVHLSLAFNPSHLEIVRRW